MTKAGETKRATIYDVAKEASVSHQTVARFVRGSVNIAPELSDRIRRAIADLDYHTNATARSLATRRSNVIGVLAANVYEYGPTQTLVGIRDAAQAAGYLLEVVRVNPSVDEEVDSTIQFFQRGNLAGLLVIATGDALREAIADVERGMPVRIWQEADYLVEGTQLTINDLGQDELVGHLQALGHQSFASISGPHSEIAARHRQAALIDALARRGLAHVSSAEGNWSAASGHLAVRKLGHDFTALIAANDQMALGAVLALEDSGVSVPDQVSVVGFDDIPEAAYFRPPLTTIRQDFFQQGQVAFGRVLADIETTSPPDTGQQAPSLVIRRSSARVRV